MSKKVPTSVLTQLMTPQEFENWVKFYEHERIRARRERIAALRRIKSLRNAPMRAEVVRPPTSVTRTETFTIDELEGNEPEMSYSERLNMGFSLLGQGD